jgi:catecholate siderophore receptor
MAGTLRARPLARILLALYRGPLTSATALRVAALPLCALAPCANAAPPDGPPDGDAVRLPPIEVTAKAPARYQGITTRVGKSEQAPRDVPQSLTVITEALIRDRGADTLHEALRNAAGITFNAGEGGRNGDNVTLRGYSIVGDLYLDGLRDIAQYNRETFNLEQVDVLRGAASMLFGRGSTGGIVNQVSKTPLLRDRGAADATVGSYAFRRTTVDVNRVLGDTSALRLNAMATAAGSHRDGVEFERHGLAPAYAWGLGSPDQVDLAYYWEKENNVPDYGVPYFQGRPLPVPTSRFYGLANADYERYESGIATARYTHRGDDVEWRTVARYGNYARDLWPSAPRLSGNPAVVTDMTPVSRSRPGRDGRDRDTTLQSDVSWHGATGSLWHDLLAGLEYAHEHSHTRRWSNVPGSVPLTTVGDPDAWPALPPAILAKANVSVTDFTSDTVGVYGQDTIQLAPEWKVAAGARHDDYDAHYERAEPLGPLARTDRVWSWRAGVLYQPGEHATYYASYGTSFNPSGELYALDPRAANTPPEKSRNYEVGAKWELRGGDLSLRTALFRSEKTNERNTDPLETDVYLLSGRRHTDGIEVELAGRLTPRWEVFGGAAWMHGRIDRSINAAEAGRWPPNTPPYTASVWTTYALGAFRIGGGVEAVGRRYTTSANTTALPAYVRVDGLVEWRHGPYSLQLNVYNVLDAVYYEGLYTGHTVPGTPRTFHLSAGYRF